MKVSLTGVLLLVNSHLATTSTFILLKTFRKSFKSSGWANTDVISSVSERVRAWMCVCVCVQRILKLSHRQRYKQYVLSQWNLIRYPSGCTNSIHSNSAEFKLRRDGCVCISLIIIVISKGLHRIKFKCVAIFHRFYVTSTAHTHKVTLPHASLSHKHTVHVLIEISKPMKQPPPTFERFKFALCVWCVCVRVFFPIVHRLLFLLPFHAPCSSLCLQYLHNVRPATFICDAF